MPPVITHSGSRDALVGAALVLISAIAFSAKAVFIKLAYAYSVDAVTLMTLRMLIATPFFIVMAVWASQDRSTYALSLRDWISVVVLGLTGMYLSQLFDFLGLEYVSASMERTILFLYPTFVVLITAMRTGNAIGRIEMIALALSYAGIILVAEHELLSAGTTEKTRDIFMGAGFVLISAITYAYYMAGSGVAIQKLGTQRFTGYTMVISCLAVLGHYSATHPVASLVLPGQVYVLGVAMAIVSTVLPILLLNAGISRIGGNKASLISSAGPVATLMLAVLFLNEAITVKQIMGTCLVLAGVLLIVFSNRK